MSYLINGRYLFAGDTMSLHNGLVNTFNAAFNMDSAAQRNSIRKLAETIQADYLFTGHYSYTDDIAGAFKEWRSEA